MKNSNKSKIKKYCSHCGSRTEKYYSPETVAEIFDCSIEKIRKMIQKREIAYKKIGRLVRIPASEIERVGMNYPDFDSYYH